jgi:UDP-glucose 4-epimerase
VKVLVTGAAGFIGSNLVKKLSEFADVRGIDDLSTGFLRNLDGLNIDFVEESILNETVLNKLMNDCDAVVHLAARPSVPRSIAEPFRSHEVNATGTLRVLEAAKNLHDPLVIVASSSSVYGANPTLPKSEAALPMPMSPYAVSKLAAEQYTLAWQYSFGMKTLPFRFFNVFGPNQAPDHDYAAVVPTFVASALRNEPLQINGDGLQSRDFTYVGTVCDVISAAVTKKTASSSPVNLAFGTRTSLLEIVDLLEEITGTHLQKIHREQRIGDVRHSQADNTLLQELFPEIQPVSLRDGLEQTVQWLRIFLGVSEK